MSSYQKERTIAEKEISHHKRTHEHTPDENEQRITLFRSNSSFILIVNNNGRTTISGKNVSLCECVFLSYFPSSSIFFFSKIVGKLNTWKLLRSSLPVSVEIQWANEISFPTNRKTRSWQRPFYAPKNQKNTLFSPEVQRTLFFSLKLKEHFFFLKLIEHTFFPSFVREANTMR